MSSLALFASILGLLSLTTIVIHESGHLLMTILISQRIPEGLEVGLCSWSPCVTRPELGHAGDGAVRFSGGLFAATTLFLLLVLAFESWRARRSELALAVGLAAGGLGAFQIANGIAEGAFSAAYHAGSRTVLWASLGSGLAGLLAATAAFAVVGRSRHKLD